MEKAKLVRRYGAAVVVMAFDEAGQADTVKRKVEICAEAYRILTQDVGFPRKTSFSTRISSGGHRHRGTQRLRRGLLRGDQTHQGVTPGALISGGVSNVSFSYRGAPVVREAMHSAFLYHAIQAGMDMGIVNPSQLAVYTDVAPELLVAVEDVLLNRRPDSTERLTTLAERFKGKTAEKEADLSWRNQPVGPRLSHALVEGIVDYIDADTEECRKGFARAIE